MNITRVRPRLHISKHGRQKKEDLFDIQQSNLNSTLSPDVQLSVPEFPKKSSAQNASKIGRYILLDQQEGETFRAVNWQTYEEYICKVRIFFISQFDIYLFFCKKNYNIIPKDFTVGIQIRYYAVMFCNWMKCNNTSLEKRNIFKNIQILCVGLLVSHSLQFVKQRVT